MPNGYVLDTTPNPFTVESGQSISVKLAMCNSSSTEVTSTKTWDDNNNQDDLRSDSIQAQFYANDKDSVYTVKEVSNVPGYEVSADSSNQGNIIITNKHTR